MGDGHDAGTTRSVASVSQEGAEAARPEGAGRTGGDGAEACGQHPDHARDEAARLSAPPVTRADADEIAEEFYKRFPVSMIRLKNAVFELLDHGEFIALTHQETTALCDYLSDLAVKVLVRPGDPLVSPELKSAVSKLFFAHGRHYGMTNFDMGMEEDHVRRDG